VSLFTDEPYVGDANKHYIEHLTKQGSLKSQPTRIEHNGRMHGSTSCSQLMSGTMEDSEAASLWSEDSIDFFDHIQFMEPCFK
jgi:hypothetical protein